MLKLKEKDLKNDFRKVISIGYCQAQTLLKYKAPIGYTSGTYGWNSDIYLIDNIYISTGYRPISNININYELIESYEKRAKKIYTKNINYQLAIKKIDKLLIAFINEIKGGV